MDFDRLRAAVEAPSDTPLHQRLRQAIAAQVNDGTLTPGAKLPSERTLHSELEVSRATVRQALAHLIQAGLLEAIAGKGTFVRESDAAGLVGLIVTGPNFHYFYPQLAAAFSARMRQRDLTTSILLHDEETETLHELVGQLLGQGVRALAITPPRRGDPSHIEDLLAQLRRAEVPLVWVGRQSDRFTAYDCIATDNRAIGLMATQHLLECGHRDIVHLGMLDYSTGQNRALGYHEAMQAVGLPSYLVELPEPTVAMPVTEAPSDHLAAPAAQVTDLIWGPEAVGAPTAAFCFNDVVATGVCQALQAHGIRVPEDVSLVAVDNIVRLPGCPVPLTTFALPGEAIGQQSADLLLRRLSGDDDPPQTRLLMASLIERQSTAPCAGRVPTSRVHDSDA